MEEKQARDRREEERKAVEQRRREQDLCRRAEEETKAKLQAEFEKSLKLREDQVSEKDHLLSQFQREKTGHELKIRELETQLTKKPKEVVVEKKVEVPGKADEWTVRKLETQIEELQRKVSDREKELKSAQDKASALAQAPQKTAATEVKVPADNSA